MNNDMTAAVAAAKERVAGMRARLEKLDGDSLDLIFGEARTHNAWQARAVEVETLQAIYDVAKFGPTSANCLPMRIVFVRSPEAKERLRPLLLDANREKSMAAPVTAIIGYDLRFFTEMKRTFPHMPGFADIYANNAEMAAEHAARNGSLQGGYFIIAARALGLDTGPMSGFDADGVNKEFFGGDSGSVRVNFLCNLGYGDASGVYPRGPRLEFSETCKVV